MSVAISALKNKLSRKFKGANIDNVQGISNFSLFEEAAQNMLPKLDPNETIRRERVNVFADVNDYTPPNYLKGKKVIDLYPVVNRTPNQNFDQSYMEEFDREKRDYDFSVEYENGNKVLRISRHLGGSLNVDTVNAITGWSGTVTNIAVDTILQFESGGSLRFDLGASGGYIEKSITSIDLSDHENKSSLFRYFYFPDKSIITSVTLRIGSDSSNYFEITGTRHFGSLVNGTNLYRFDWNGATETGTVDTSAIDYERVTIVSTAADTDIRMGQLTSKLPKEYEVKYYSDRIFKNASGDWLEAPTANADTVELEGDAINIFFYECCHLIAEDMQKPKQAEKFDIRLNGKNGKSGLYGNYKTDKPEQAIRTKGRYYRTRSHHINAGVRSNRR